MRHCRRIFLVKWFCFCTAVAMRTASQMFVPFVPGHTESIGRVRRFRAKGILITGGLRVVKAKIMVGVG